jgi:hypothetical protein
MNSLNLQENAILDPTSPHLTDKKNLKRVKEGGSNSEDGFEERGDFIIDVVGTSEKEGKGGSSHSELFQWKNW